jgi:hypothetical protein
MRPEEMFLSRSVTYVSQGRYVKQAIRSSG